MRTLLRSFAVAPSHKALTIQSDADVRQAIKYLEIAIELGEMAQKSAATGT